MNKRFILDFCVYWGKLARLIQVPRKNGCMAKWNKCGLESVMSRYKGKIFGIDIKIKKILKKREKKDKRKEQEGWFEGLAWKEAIERRLEWKIWSNHVDLDVNLQWLTCTNTFWFDCLTKWMYLKSTCPMWKTQLNQLNIRPNKEWKQIINILEVEPQKPKQPEWIWHKQDSKLFWTTWCSFICHKWIVSKTHNEHNIIENEDVVKELQTKWTNELLENRTFTKKIQNYIKGENFCKELNQLIFDSSAETICNLLANMKSSFAENLARLSKSNSQELGTAINSLKLNESTIKSFNAKNDLSSVTQVSKALVENINIKKESEKSIENYRIESKRYNLLFEESPTEYAFSYFTSNLNAEGNDKLKVGRNPTIEVWIVKKNSENKTVVWARINDETKSQWTLKIALEENNFCIIKNNNMVLLNSNDGLTDICKLEMKVSKWGMILNHELKFKLFFLKIDDKIKENMKTNNKILIEAIVDGFNRSRKAISHSNSEEEKDESTASTEDRELEIEDIDSEDCQESDKESDGKPLTLKINKVNINLKEERPTRYSKRSIY